MFFFPLSCVCVRHIMNVVILVHSGIFLGELFMYALRNIYLVCCARGGFALWSDIWSDF